MARQIGRLKALTVTRTKEKGLYADGGGLVPPNFARREQILDLPVSHEWTQNAPGYGPGTGAYVGENPARWRGHLDKLLPARSKVQKVKHHKALSYTEIGGFMEKLREQEGFAARALEWLILTASRTSETIGATWDEIDFEAKIWTIPAERIKGGKEHRVPLSSEALKIAKEMYKLKDGGYVFQGGKRGKPLSTNALLALLKRMDHQGLTAHGFRSTFRDWAAEQTNYPCEVAEMALAHTIEDKVEAAYRRGDLFEKRRRLMAEWAKYCDRASTTAQVVPINPALSR